MTFLSSSDFDKTLTLNYGVIFFFIESVKILVYNSMKSLYFSLNIPSFLGTPNYILPHQNYNNVITIPKLTLKYSFLKTRNHLGFNEIFT